MRYCSSKICLVFFTFLSPSYLLHEIFLVGSRESGRRDGKSRRSRRQKKKKKIQGGLTCISMLASAMALSKLSVGKQLKRALSGWARLVCRLGVRVVRGNKKNMSTNWPFPATDFGAQHDPMVIRAAWLSIRARLWNTRKKKIERKKKKKKKKSLRAIKHRSVNQSTSYT